MSELAPFHLPSRAARDLGFLEVQGILSSLCFSPYGREALEQDIFPSSMDALITRLEESLEGRAAVERKVAPDFGSLKDVRPILEAIPKGVVLGAPEILDVAKTLDGLARLHDVITFQRDEAPRLVELAEDIDDDRRFVKRVQRSFDESGQLTDDASPALAQLRGKVRALRAEAQEKLQTLIVELDDAGTLRDRNFTLRNDRYVVPVKSEYQGRVDGIVHDASQTGQTVFIEPRALLQIGNRIKIARSEVIEEENRILQDLTLEVGEHGPRLTHDLARAARIEAAFARGTFAARIDGRRPLLEAATKTSRWMLYRARHPLLAWMRDAALRRGDAHGPIIDNDVGFGAQRALIVSGPNAGGKTVALKTFGLIAILARAGIPVPCDEDSVVPLCAAVLATVGDEQSLGEGLSSFSGHLVALRGILDELEQSVARGPVLVLLDELLSGTDPSQGASLAQSLLEHLVDKGAYVVATTHYERLKALALIDEIEAEGGKRIARFRNASVALEPGTGRPTFRLVLDQAGTSNAMEAARRYGLPDDVIGRAERLQAPDERDLQQMIAALAERQGALERRLSEASEEKAKFEIESRRLEKKLADVEREAARLRREGAKAFLDELKEARRLVAEAIEATKGPADARTLNRMSHDLQLEEQRARAQMEPPAAQRSELLRPASVKAGDVVEVTTMPGSRLTVLEVSGDEAVVGRGSMRMRAALDTLRAPGSDADAETKRNRASRGSVGSQVPPALGTEPKTTDNSLDVRGQRVDEALEVLEPFLDRLLRQGRSRAYILHGHGSGALKKAVRAALQASRYVERSGAADPDEGGDGVTVAHLRG
jgi:DNA mismatch repair protein MutS2